jgi:hypothetical protein
MPDTPRPFDPPPTGAGSFPAAPPPNGQPAAGAGPAPPARRRRSHSWIWYFVTLLVLSLIATGVIIAYNWGQQLTPERLEKARKLWEEKGPKDYEYRYTKRVGDDERGDHFHVVVRGGKVRSVTLNDTIQIPKNQFTYYGMLRMFDDIEDLLKRDSQPGKPQVFKMARFSAEDGHVLRYVRRVMGGRERVKITVEQFKRLDGKGK